MSEMVVRVARAIATYANGSADMWENWQEEARAAIEAMREPDKHMIDAGITAAGEVEDWPRDTDGSYRADTPSDMPKPVWHAMIDAALQPDRLTEKREG
ncbi:MAG: hypothetical protein J7500_15870 [Sphingomonas sp.]|uniref:hypothetical protein n=1 Tax=Sphingomonas sp. TaxID=28214 RepID=UPI001B0E6A5F|nr:hypothetical protein [Sphingomonas sp.]MBO9624186.1 hypothetical protein [Sphingomonas sp.]